MHKINRLQVGCDIYDVTAAYRCGAEAYRASVSYHHNPHDCNTQAYYDWDNGHTNDSAGFHYTDDGDVITAKQNGTLFVYD